MTDSFDAMKSLRTGAPPRPQKKVIPALENEDTAQRNYFLFFGVSSVILGLFNLKGPSPIASGVGFGVGFFLFGFVIYCFNLFVRAFFEYIFIRIKRLKLKMPKLKMPYINTAQRCIISGLVSLFIFIPIAAWCYRVTRQPWYHFDWSWPFMLLALILVGFFQLWLWRGDAFDI